ncbi:MAG TPA: hypothetical protein VHT92_02315 [Candidatus Cybelea sp.]|nr:hypothetical protein [Candidatus Cybelea sp.]
MRNAAFRSYIFSAVVFLALAATAAPSRAINRDWLPGARNVVAVDTPQPIDNGLPPPTPPPPSTPAPPTASPTAAPPVVSVQRLVAFDTPVPMDSSIPPPPPPPPEPTPSGTNAPTPSPGGF